MTLDPEVRYKLESRRILDQQIQQKYSPVSKLKAGDIVAIGNRNIDSGYYECIYPDGTSKPVGVPLGNTKINPKELVKSSLTGLTTALETKVTFNPGITKPSSNAKEQNPSISLGDKGKCQGYFNGQIFTCLEKEPEKVGNVKVLGFIFNGNPGELGSLDLYVFGWKEGKVDKVCTLTNIKLNVILESGNYENVNNYPNINNTFPTSANKLLTGDSEFINATLDAYKGDQWSVTLAFKTGVSNTREKIIYQVYRNTGLIFEKVEFDDFVNVEAGDLFGASRAVVVSYGNGFWFKRKVKNLPSIDFEEFDHLWTFRCFNEVKQGGYHFVNGPDIVSDGRFIASPGDKLFSNPKYVNFAFQNQNNNNYWYNIRISKNGSKALANNARGLNSNLLVYFDKGYTYTGFNLDASAGTDGANTYSRLWLDVFDNQGISQISHFYKDAHHYITTKNEINLSPPLTIDNTIDLATLQTEKIKLKLTRRDNFFQVKNQEDFTIYPLKVNGNFDVLWMSNSKEY